MYGKRDVPNGSICMDCTANTSELNEFYMLNDEIWLRAVPGRAGMLCIGCVEARLGRRLRGGDFDFAWSFMSSQDRWSERLRARALGLPDAVQRVNRAVEDILPLD